MADMMKHSQAERLAVASLAGALQYECKRIRAGATLEEAVAALHTISSDPHLLAHAWPAPDDAPDSLRRQLAVAAGADVDEATRIHTRPPRATGGQLGRRA